MTQVPEETPDSLVDDVADDEDLRDESFSPELTSRDLPMPGTDGDPASFLNR